MKKKTKQKTYDSVNARLQNKKLNPFEIHINRRKYDVLGMKSKAERGLPGISRTKALKKRKGTLLQEYKLKDKKNLFWDRRIGERNSAMTAEDKILARFTAERMKFHSKKSIYNLGDEEELTHKGQTLTEIEKFEDPKSEDEEDEDGKLDPSFVEDVHFGGGIFKKVNGEQKSRKDLIDQLIAESIKRKAEKQKLRQHTLDMTEKLDSDWKELLPLVTATKKSKLNPEPVIKNDDKFADYDVLSKKLKFEARGKPSDRLKSEEEIAKEEKEKLEKLEKERIQRMLGETHVKTINHRSADDMDDGFEILDGPETTLAYKDGVLHMEGSEFDVTTSKTGTDVDKGIEILSNVDGNDEEENKAEVVEKSENEDDSESEGDSDDSYSDLKESGESDVEVQNIVSSNENDKSLPSKENNENEVESKEVSDIPTTVSHDLENNSPEVQAAMEMARKELPFTFEIPTTYEQFEKLMNGYDSNFQAVIIERMIKCNHPTLKPENKEDLDMLYTFLLQHIQDCASGESTNVTCFRTLDRLAPWFFDLTQWNAQKCASGLREVIKEKYLEFLKSPKRYPSLDTLIFFKLVSLLFPTSDFRHPVVTPTLTFMLQVLFQCKIQSSVDLSSGLYITTLILEYCILSKRFVPEAINFLYCVLRLAHPRDSAIPIRLPLQLKTFDTFSLISNCDMGNIECPKLSVHDLIKVNSTEKFKITCLSLALDLLSKFCDFWKEGQYAILVFERFIPLLDTKQFDEILKDSVETVLTKILKFKQENLQMLTLEKKKPKPLRLYEPHIEEVYALKRFSPMGKKKAERAKLLHKYKREMKGALREIRRDRSFLYKLRYKETVRSDVERQRKVQEILSSAAEQQGELRNIKRKK